MDLANDIYQISITDLTNDKGKNVINYKSLNRFKDNLNKYKMPESRLINKFLRLGTGYR